MNAPRDSLYLVREITVTDRGSTSFDQDLDSQWGSLVSAAEIDAQIGFPARAVLVPNRSEPGAEGSSRTIIERQVVGFDPDLHRPLRNGVEKTFDPAGVFLRTSFDPDLHPFFLVAQVTLGVAKWIGITGVYEVYLVELEPDVLDLRRKLLSLDTEECVEFSGGREEIPDRLELFGKGCSHFGFESNSFDPQPQISCPGKEPDDIDFSLERRLAPPGDSRQGFDNPQAFGGEIDLSPDPADLDFWLGELNRPFHQLECDRIPQQLGILEDQLVTERRRAGRQVPVPDDREGLREPLPQLFVEFQSVDGQFQLEIPRRDLAAATEVDRFDSRVEGQPGDLVTPRILLRELEPNGGYIERTCALEYCLGTGLDAQVRDNHLWGVEQGRSADHFRLWFRHRPRSGNRRLS